jgi:DMSO reductase family type II enzyme heme b subunit
MNRRTFAQATVGVAAVGIAASLTGWSAARHYDHGERAPSYTSRRVAARRIAGEIPMDPGDPAWQGLPPVDVPLIQQYMIEPRLGPEGLITNIALRAMHNGTDIGFQVSWEDPRNDDIEAAAHFRDSVAIQLPVDTGRPVLAVMGQPGRAVHILHWRASWQRAIESGSHTVRDAFPNAVSDLSPEDVLDGAHASAYYPALSAGNAMAIRERTSPVEELVAEGYGTITTHSEQRARGHGVHSGGRWQVVVALPLAGGTNKPTLRPGGETLVALAVWNGAKGDRGARKQFADWTTLELDA